MRLDAGEELAPARVLAAAGRAPHIDGLGLEAAGVEVGERGITVDGRCRAAEGIWAVGDVTGVMPFTHVAKYQARVACNDIIGQDARADYRAVPRVVFCDPEVAAVGLTAEQARGRGTDVTSARIHLPDVLARPWTYEREPRGELALVADRARGVLIGAWAVAPLAAEWIHVAALAIRAAVPLATVRDVPAQFPTFSEAYLTAVERLSPT